MKHMTLEELKTLTMPVKLVCCDGYFRTPAKEIVVLSSTPDDNNLIPILGDDNIYSLLYTGSLHHYALHKQPNTKRFYERVGRQTWVADDGQMHSGLTQLGCDIKACDYFKTGRYFDWDMDSNKIIGKVEEE